MRLRLRIINLGIQSSWRL